MNLLYEENEVFGGWFNEWRKVLVIPFLEK